MAEIVAAAAERVTVEGTIAAGQVTAKVIVVVVLAFVKVITVGGIEIVLAEAVVIMTVALNVAFGVFV